MLHMHLPCPSALWHPSQAHLPLLLHPARPPDQHARASREGSGVVPTALLPLAGTYFNMRKTTIYGGSNEVQRNIVAQTVLGS